MANQPQEIEKKQNEMMFSPGSERNIISICLKESDKIFDVESKNVYPEHFLVKGNKHIFSAMMYLKSKQVKPTAMSILEVLSTDDAKKEINDLGGLDYLMLLEETYAPAENLDLFIEKVKQSHARRSLYDISDDIKRFVTSEKAEVLNPSEIVSYAETRITDLGVNATATDEVYKAGDDTDRVLKERAERPAQIPGLEFGWTQYDRYTNGAQAGDLIIVAAPSKTGKSVTLTNWAKKVAIDDKLPILYIDTEMNSRENEDRLLAMESGIPHDEIVSGMYVMDTDAGMATDKMARLKKAKEKLKEGNYYHVYMPQFTIEAVTTLARKFQMQCGIVALFFDYIKIPSNQADFRSSQEYQKLGFFTSGLKDLAGMLQLPVISACQTNRSNAGGKGNEAPDESDIGGSYRILQLASKLMFLYNKTAEQIAKDGFQNGNQQLFIKWQRNGQSDCPPINIMFDKPIVRQSEA